MDCSLLLHQPTVLAGYQRLVVGEGKGCCSRILLYPSEILCLLVEVVGLVEGVVFVLQMTWD